MINWPISNTKTPYLWRLLSSCCPVLPGHCIHDTNMSPDVPHPRKLPKQASSQSSPQTRKQYLYQFHLGPQARKSKNWKQSLNKSKSSFFSKLDITRVLEMLSRIEGGMQIHLTGLRCIKHWMQPLVQISVLCNAGQKRSFHFYWYLIFVMSIHHTNPKYTIDFHPMTTTWNMFGIKVMHPKASEQYGQVRNNRIGEQLAACTSIRGYQNYEEVIFFKERYVVSYMIS